MNVGILGTGEVGRALGRGFIALGHAVKTARCLSSGGTGVNLERLAVELDRPESRRYSCHYQRYGDKPFTPIDGVTG
jgi:hypothetical protein